MFQKWERKEQIWSWRYVECVVVCFLFNFLYVAYIIVARSFSHSKPSQYSRGLALQIYALQFQPPNNFPSGTRVVFLAKNDLQVR